MKIAQIAPLYEAVPPRFYGGTERVVAHLANALVDQGHEVTLFASADTQTRARLAPFRRAQFRLPGRLLRSYEEHDAIVTAVLRADAANASRAAYAHVSTVSDASIVFARNAEATL